MMTTTKSIALFFPSLNLDLFEPSFQNNNRAYPIAPSAAADALRSVAGTSSSSKLPAGGPGSSSIKKGAKKGSAAANAAAAAAAAVAKIRGRKRKKGEAVTWQLRPFENAARGDEGEHPLKLTHWVKCLFPAKLLAPPQGTSPDEFDYDAAAKEARANADPADGGAPYPFAAFNKRPKALRYDDDEWGSVVPPAQGWDREESDYLLDMLDRFGLRFHVVADRYMVRFFPSKVFAFSSFFFFHCALSFRSFSLLFSHLLLSTTTTVPRRPDPNRRGPEGALLRHLARSPRRARGRRERRVAPRRRPCPLRGLARARAESSGRAAAGAVARGRGARGRGAGEGQEDRGWEEGRGTKGGAGGTGGRCCCCCGGGRGGPFLGQRSFLRRCYHRRSCERRSCERCRCSW